jgi:hypothetical protein
MRPSSLLPVIMTVLSFSSTVSHSVCTAYCFVLSSILFVVRSPARRQPTADIARAETPWAGGKGVDSNSELLTEQQSLLAGMQSHPQEYGSSGMSQPVESVLPAAPDRTTGSDIATGHILSPDPNGNSSDAHRVQLRRQKLVRDQWIVVLIVALILFQYVGCETGRRLNIAANVRNGS